MFEKTNEEDLGLFTATKRDEDYLVIRKSDGRPLVSVDRARIRFDEQFKEPKRIEEIIPVGKRTLHFTGARLTVADLKALASVIDKLP